MRRVSVLVAAVLSMLLVGAVGIAQAQDDPVPPEFAPPAVAPVTDVPSAEAFSDAYVARNARRFLRTDRRRVRVIDVQSACLQSPIVETRFGCVFTLRALVIQRRHHWRDWSHSSKARTSGHKPKPRHRVRIRTYGCLGFLRIDGGPVVTPSAQVINVECARLPRRDLEAPEPEPAPTV